MVRASVEVFKRAEEKSFCLAVEPRSAVEGLKRHLAAQSEEVEVSVSAVAGDLNVNLINGKSIEDVLSGVAIIIPVDTEK